MSQIVNKFLAQMPTLTLKGNNTGGTANAADLTVAQVNAILPVFTSSLNGLAPLSGGGTTNFLRADGTWAAPTSSGANTTLSNLTSPTAINQDLLPATTNLYNLGSSSLVWAASYVRQMYTPKISVDNSSFAEIFSMSGDATTIPSGATLPYIAQTNIAGATQSLRSLAIVTNNSGVANANSTGDMRIETGNKTAGTGNSGLISLQTGTSAGGTRGIISLNGSAIDANSTQIHNVTDPTSAQDAATKNYVDTHASSYTPNKETFVLSGTDITNQYVDLAHVAKTGSIIFMVQGSGYLLEGASYDYSVSYTGGAGGNTRITFLNGLATGGNSALVATDVVQVNYAY